MKLRGYQTLAVALNFLFVLLCPIRSDASPQVGTLTQMQGDVRLLTRPGSRPADTVGAGEARVLFEGTYFVARAARPGDRLEKGNVVRTLPGGKARVIFDNGDQFQVGSATEYKVAWDRDAGDGRAVVQLAYGKIRGIVGKGGPRSRLVVKTRSATMGVRGTDFFIADDGAESGAEISILRGAVEVRPQGTPEAKPISVPAGATATVAAPPTPEPPVVDAGPAGAGTVAAAPPPLVTPAVEIRQTSRQELVAIQSASTLAPATAPAPAALGELEKKAIAATLEDVKATDPVLFAQLSARAVTSVDEIHAGAVDALKKDAPAAPPARKPRWIDTGDPEREAYDKYFKKALD